MKKIAIFLLSTIITSLLSFHSGHICAQTWPPTDMLGSGTDDEPWEITTIDHLAALAAYVNTGNGWSTTNKYYILMNDIDLAGWEEFPGDTCGWNPIGKDNSIFETQYHFFGNFNGNGKIVKNMTINRQNNQGVGLFGAINNAFIQNVGIENCNVIGNACVGGLVGAAQVSTISDCQVSGIVKGHIMVGGLIGANASETTNCYASVSVSSVGDLSRSRYIGGLAGICNSSSSIISNCYATGNVNGYSLLGGLTGCNSGRIANSYASGNVIGMGAYVGGLVGHNNSNTSIVIDCVAANDTVIGFDNHAFTANAIHRISGHNCCNDTNTRNYASTQMTLIIDGIQTIPLDDSRESGISENLTLLTLFNFYNTANYWDGGAWDMDSVWTICDSVSLPHLRRQQITNCQQRIFASSNNHGGINPSGFIVMDRGENQIFTFTPNYGYYLDSVFINGLYEPSAVSNGSYTFNNITSNHTIHATFATDSNFITASIDQNGYINPSGTIMASLGSNKRFVFFGNPGYVIDSLWIDDINVPDSIPNGSYTFHNVIEDHSIRITTRVADFHYCGGSGTQTDPYLICSVDDLAALATYVNICHNDSTRNKYYLLMNDIDLAGWEVNPNDTCGWIPIAGHSSDRNVIFQGHFDGAGKVIRNITINRPTESYVGLFGSIGNGSIRNLGIENCHVKGYNHVGGLVASVNTASIDNCWISGIVEGEHDIVGGMAGYINSSSVTNSFFDGNVLGNSRVGGLIGYNYNSSHLENCHAIGYVHGYGDNIGGLVGYDHFVNSIINCYTSVNVTGTQDQIGGLVGYSFGGEISGCYASGNVSGANIVGGLAGFIWGTDISNTYAMGNVSGSGRGVGGLVGNATFRGAINYCYAAGDVVGNNGVGGLVGIAEDGAIIQNCMAVNLNIAGSTTNTNRIVGWDYQASFPNVYHNNYAINDMILTVNGIVATRTDDNMQNGIAKSIDILQVLDFYNTANYWYQDAWRIDDDLEEIWTICNHSTFPIHTWQDSIECKLIITATAGNHGMIDPAGFFPIAEGENQTFAFYPNPNYHIDSVFVDGVFVPSATTDEIYTFSNVTSDHTIHVTFAINSYTISATAGNHGIITPEGEIEVSHGDRKTFTFAPEEGYTLAALFVDGVLKQIPENQTYVFENVTSDHTIHIDFSVNIAEYDFKNSTKLYPNPANHQVVLEFINENRYAEVKYIELYDVYGKLLETLPVTSSITPIKISHLSSGIYFIRLNIGNNMIIKKLVKE